MQNFMDNMKPQTEESADGVPWWMKYAGKAAGAIGGGVAIFFGVWTCVTISPICIVAGIWQMLAGFVVILIEAPFCCMFLDFVQQFAGMVEGRPVWQKAALYLGLSLPAVLLCLGLSTLVGSGAIFGCAVLNGMQVLGKKGSQADMAAMANAENGMGDDDDAILDKDQYGQQQYP